jgi:cytochrome c-type biogenesis protein CcmH/NrfF
MSPLCRSHLVGRRLLLALAAILAVVLALPALAQDDATSVARSPGEVSSMTSELSQEIYSPYCPGKTVAMCPSGGASDLRQEIQTLVADGKTKDQIKETIIERYGEEYRMVDPPDSDNYTLLGVIGGAFVVCLLAIWLLSGRRKIDTGPDPDAAPAEDLSADDQAYLDELREEL